MARRDSPPSRQPRSESAPEDASQSIWSEETIGKHTTLVTPDAPVGQSLKLDDEGDANVCDEARNQSLDGNRLESISHSLRPGGSNSQTNPFLKRRPVPRRGDADPALDSSFARLDLDEASQGSNPWQSTADAPVANPPRMSETLPNENEGDVWLRSFVPIPSDNAASGAASPTLMSLPSEDEPGWEDGGVANRRNEPLDMHTSTAMTDELLEDRHAWEDVGPLSGEGSRGLEMGSTQQAQLDDWSLIDTAATSNPSKLQDVDREAENNEAPPLSPRELEPRPKWVSPTRRIDGQSETYQVKKIRWHDELSTSNPRISQILIQNQNGPCPLVALVNALLLTTPADEPETALVHILRSREQVTLNLLLDAVFDELMSPRRTSSEDSLPDVTDLYAFLQSLHTGMNVNPRFVPTREMMVAYKRTSLTHLDPVERAHFIPGTFENTMEMSLYATFSIPLIHGWLPSRSDPVYEALERQGASYEEAQNLLFREEELESRLSNHWGGLSEPETEIYQDILTIKSFLAESATQLTAWGIEVISKAMRPGTFAILFRNDHFSTLYCHPRTGQLLSLVTDAGYGGHTEVVWESLADVNGEHTEYLSGDFKIVSATQSDESSGFETYPSGTGESTARQVKHDTTREQEDRDLALALQLQEEENQRQVEDEARRRRESLLSEQFIEQQGQRPTPVARNAARAAMTGGSRPDGRSREPSGMGPGMAGARTAITRQLSGQNERAAQTRLSETSRVRGVAQRAESRRADAPPSYEQAAQDPAFVPPAGHPTHARSQQSTPRAMAGGMAYNQ